MNGRNMKISMEQLRSGMVVAQPIKDCNGRFLIGAGVQLTDKQLRILRIWRITEVEIDGVYENHLSAGAEGGIDPSIPHAAVERMKERFRHTNPDHPVVRELFRLCLEKVAENGAKDGAHVATAPSTGKDARFSPARPVDLEKLMQQNIRLPALPTIFTEIQRVIHDPRCSFRAIATVIAKDTGLTAQVLKLVNSPLYSFPTHIDSIQRAVTVIGTRQLSTLALGISAMNVFKGISQDLVDMKAFWKHSICCGIFSRIIASYKNISNTERLFIGGLLHDVGRIVLFSYMADHARGALLEASGSKEILHSVEARALGFTHADLGAKLLRTWKLPVFLESIVQDHHQPALSPYPLESSIIHVADVMANAFGMGSSGESLVPPLDLGAWDMLKLEVEAIRQIVNDMEHQLRELGRFLVENE